MKKSVFKAFVWLAIGIGFVWLLHAIKAQGQQTIAPFKTSQANTQLYVNMGIGGYATIQATVTAGCALTHAQVVILPGANPADSPTSASGCTGVAILDYTTIPFTTYGWNGTVYAAISASGLPGGTGIVKVTSGSASLAAAADVTGLFTGGLPCGPTNTLLGNGQCGNIPVVLPTPYYGMAWNNNGALAATNFGGIPWLSTTAAPRVATTTDLAGLLASYVISSFSTSGTNCAAASYASGALNIPACNPAAGSLTSFAAPSASWPAWLVPTVTNPTTTPSLAVAASAIPNSALANNSITVNSQACGLGASCTIASVASLSGGAVGSAPYQSAANTTSFIASPTTAATTFLYGWQPSGSAIAPAALSLSTLLASPPAIGSTAAAAGTFTTLTATSGVFSDGSSGQRTGTFPLHVWNNSANQLIIETTAAAGYGVLQMGSPTGLWTIGTGGASTGTLWANNFVFNDQTGGNVAFSIKTVTEAVSFTGSTTTPEACAGTTTSDTCLSRVSAGVAALGNGTAGNTTGTLNLLKVLAGPTSYTPSTTYTLYSITNPASGTTTPLIQAAQSSTNTIYLVSPGWLALESASGIGGSIGDGTRVDFAWDGAGDVTVSATDFTIAGRSSVFTGTSSNTNLDGEVTLASGTYTYTFLSGFTIHPICTANDASGTANPVGVSYGGGPGPGTAYSVTFTGTGTDLVDYHCLGRS